MQVRKRILFGLLAFVAAWPVVHVGLVERYDLNPWHYFGLSMYAVPPGYQWVHLVELRDGREVNIHDSWLTDEARALLHKFRANRYERGNLTQPHALAQQVLADRPDVQALKILCQKDMVSPQTSLNTVGSAVAYFYER